MSDPAAGALPRAPVLLLDVMDTLVHDPFHRTVPEVFGVSLDDYFAAKSRDAYLAFEKGEITESTYARRLFTDDRVADLSALKAAFRPRYRWIEGIPELLDELSAAGLVLHALSNYSVWYRMIEEQLRLSERLPWTFVSALTGLRKPAPEAFLHAARVLGRPPSELLFVDDREKNCAGARAVGLDAIRFTDTPALRRALVARGVLTP